MNYLDAIILGVVEGLTEFLPVSSTGHLTIVEKWLGLKTDAANVTGFTAVIQMGAIVAAVVFFRRDIWLIASNWVLGLFKSEYRGKFEHRMGWYVIAGTIPIGIVGLALKHVIENDLRSLWVVAIGLIVWSFAMLAAERAGRQQRSERDLTLVDALVVGLMQCIALIPGVSRSGATISAGLFRQIDRVTATRLSFFLGIPALLAAGALELPQALKDSHGAGANVIPVGVTVVATVVSFVVAYAAIAWLLRFVSHHSIGKFAPYRIGLGVLVIVLLATNVMTAT